MLRIGKTIRGFFYRILTYMDCGACEAARQLRIAQEAQRQAKQLTQVPPAPVVVPEAEEKKIPVEPVVVGVGYNITTPKSNSNA